MNKTLDIFRVSDSPNNVICPPDQVFQNSNFEYMLTSGGHLVEDESQYALLMDFLKEIGEKEFVLRENWGATITDSKRSIPLEASFTIESVLSDFNEKLKEFDEKVFMAGTILHWFVNGQKDTWGIYISEYPTINIIGCLPELASGFRKIFNIKDNGYEQEKSLLESEFESAKSSNFRKVFLANYKIKNAPQQK
ncbi:hypothetical protein [Cellulophaga baltica]|uniref:hypothetical protein n=1 Tax=Cellulophaga baltica TaxID=76594 RepID=UPI0003FE33F9|nr:hypothetical protein [Cellulophaga baltica]